MGYSPLPRLARRRLSIRIFTTFTDNSLTDGDFSPYSSHCFKRVHITTYNWGTSDAMPGALRNVLKTMLGSREGELPSIQTFPPLDLDQIANELRLDARAKEEGKREQPATDGKVEGLTELDIFAEIERRARKAREDYQSLLDLYDGRIRRALLWTDLAVAIDAAGENALTDFKVQAGDDLDHLHLAGKEVEGREREFNEFRAKNRLVRLPNFVSRREQTVRILVLAILFIGESLLNGTFFAEGSETGLIGGIVQALVLSLLNIGAAVLYALYGLPLLTHKSHAIKTVGICITAMYAAWAFLLNLIIGHIRDLFILHEGKVAATAIWGRLSTAPFMLSDTQSFVLAALGVGLSIVALIDAAGLDDLYLAYGGIGRRRGNAISRYTDDKARCLAGLTQRRDEALSTMKEVIELMRSSEYELRLAIEGRSRLHQNYVAYLAHLADCRERLLRRYYEANTRARSSQSPPRFSSKVVAPSSLAHPVLTDFSDSKRETRNKAIERMEHFIKAVNHQFEEEVSKFQTVFGLTCPKETSRDLAA